MKAAYKKAAFLIKVEGGKIMDNFKLYTIEEIARILKVTERTVYNYIRNRTLSAIKIGKYWRIKHEDFESFLSNRTTK
ncbi:helix-turn-helix domain-containing protein [Methanobacterium sp. YSL]|nr:helix-turn-helix domain-containing protein [Methanobacterium sp. YSL]